VNNRILAERCFNDARVCILKYPSSSFVGFAILLGVGISFEERHRFDIVVANCVVIGFLIGWLVYSRKPNIGAIFGCLSILLALSLTLFRRHFEHSFLNGDAEVIELLDTRTNRMVYRTDEALRIDEWSNLLSKGRLVRPNCPRIPYSIVFTKNDGFTKSYFQLNKNGVALGSGDDFDIGDERVIHFLLNLAKKDSEISEVVENLWKLNVSRD
jgi:hypothetical protein